MNKLNNNNANDKIDEENIPYFNNIDKLYDYLAALWEKKDE